MATTYRAQFLQLLADRELAFDTAWLALADQILSAMRPYVNANGVIPPEREAQLRQIAGAIIWQFFLSRSPDGDPVPYTLSPNGTVYPLSPFMRLLWDGVTDAARLSVSQQAGILRKGFQETPALLRQLERAAADPLRTIGLPSERRQVLDTYLAPHERVWADGKRLFDRIELAAVDVRRKVTLALQGWIAEGMTFRDIEGRLRRFLTTGERTRYGDKGNAAAMLLARSEVIETQRQTAIASAALNPFVAEVDWVLSSGHREFDICDQHAAGSPYALADVPQRSHPNCLCSLRFRVGRAQFDMPLVLNPLNPAFIDFLLR